MKNGNDSHGLTAALRKSPINYFSDLFVVAMVTGWIVVLAIMIGVAIYVTLTWDDTSMWSDISNLVAIPLSCGGGIWMIKNSVQHVMANNRGEDARMDFPAVNADGEDGGLETAWNQTKNETEPDDESPVDDVIDEEALG